jgi:hypothetical protein
MGGGGEERYHDIDRVDAAGFNGWGDGFHHAALAEVHMEIG